MLFSKNDILVMFPKLPVEDGKLPLNHKEGTLIDFTLPEVADPEIESQYTPVTNIRCIDNISNLVPSKLYQYQTHCARQSCST